MKIRIGVSVKELIKHLETLDQDLPVVMYVGEKVVPVRLDRVHEATALMTPDLRMIMIGGY